MLWLACALNLFAAAGTARLAFLYLRADGPVGYHAQIIGAESLGPGAGRVIAALYQVFAVALLALSAGVVVVSLGGVLQGNLWAVLAVAVMLGGAGGGVLRTMRGVEAASGVRTPWRQVAVLLVLAAAGLVAGLIGR